MHHSEPALHACSLAGQERSLLGFIIPTAGTGDLFRVRHRKREREREGDVESARGRVHVAAVAQLVGEERKRLEQIRPKACCPTCLYTLTHRHTHTLTHCYVFICLSLTVLGMQHCRFSSGSLWESAPSHNIGCNQHQECKHFPDLLLTKGIF